VLSQIAAALEEAHSRGLIHRDVRPANIMWTRNPARRDGGRAVLMDFGIVAAVESGTQASTPLTAKGEVLGDPTFTSPEQLLSSRVTVATDIYSLGVTGYSMLSGKSPYPNVKGAGAIHARIDGAAEPLSALRPGTNPDLSDLLLRCLSIKPEHRPSAREVGRTLDRIGVSLATGPNY
jgi:serine/threonine-protein kinase